MYLQLNQPTFIKFKDLLKKGQHQEAFKFVKNKGVDAPETINNLLYSFEDKLNVLIVWGETKRIYLTHELFNRWYPKEVNK